MSKPTLNHVSVIKCSQIKKHYRNASIIGVGSPVHGFSNFFVLRPIFLKFFYAIPQARNQWCRRRGCRVCKSTPKSFDLVKIRAKSLKIR